MEYKDITLKDIEEVIKDIKIPERKFNFMVFFPNEEAANRWFEMFDNLVKEEAKKIIPQEGIWGQVKKDFRYEFNTMKGK